MTERIAKPRRAGIRPRRLTTGLSGVNNPPRPIICLVERFLPALVAVIAILAAETVRGASVWTALLCNLFLILAIVIPGTILWRAFGIKSRSFLEDVAIGSALGLAIEVTVMWLLNFVQLQRFAILWSAAVIVISLVASRWRTAWTRRSPATAPPVAWTLSVTVSALAGYMWRASFSTNLIQPVTGNPGQWFVSNAYVDTYFHMALSSAVMRTPLTDPMVAGQPLWYQIMVYEHIADIHQWTGIDLTLVLTRQLHLPLLALTICLGTTLAARLSSSVLAQALAPCFVAVSAVISPYQSATLAFHGTAYFGSDSPTMTFCMPLFLATAALALILLSERRIRPSLTLSLFILAFAAQGSKGTPLPVLLCGAVLTLVLGVVHHRRTPWRPLFVVLTIMAGAFIASYWLIYGASPRDMSLGDGTATLSITVFNAFGNMPGVKGYLAALMAFVGAWAFSTSPILVTMIRTKFDTGFVMCVGTGAAGLAAGLFGRAAGSSQIYFFRTVWPLVAILGAVSVEYLFHTLVGRRLRRKLSLILLLLLGAAITVAVRETAGWRPTPPTSRWVEVGTIARPLALLVAIFIVVALAFSTRIAAQHSRSGVTRLAAPLAVFLVLTQGALCTQFLTIDSPFIPAFLVNPQTITWIGSTVAVPTSGAAAARWVRDNSTPEDVIMTNMHCGKPVNQASGCDPRHFWLAGLSERQVLLEGWTYSHAAYAMTNHGGMYFGPFWDQAFFDMNDRAIREPDDQTLQWLRDHSVNWVVVDRSVFPEGAALADQAQLTFTSGDFAVYRVNA